MVQTFLGVVDRFAVAKSGPGARLRPLFQASPDKTQWIAPEEEFPNSGVVSWWQPSPDAEAYKAWTFQVESSWSFDSANEHHDLYNVKGSPSPALELIDLPDAADPEDIRALLLEQGLPLERCSSKRLVFRDRSGSVVGPLELSLRDDRLFLDEREVLINLSQPDSSMALGVWEEHRFLPLKKGLYKVGEVDFSSNTVFLKRVLREIRDMPPSVIENARLTERLIVSYSAALQSVSLTPLQIQRLKRLQKLTEKASVGITLGKEAVPDLLSLPAVKAAISKATEEEVRSALEEHGAALNQMDEQRATLEEEVGTLRANAGSLRDEIASSQKEQAVLLASFDKRIRQKFEEMGKNASAFLADLAVTRAALSAALPATALTSSSETSGEPPYAEPLKAPQVVSAFCECFDAAGLGCILPMMLLSSWVSGYVPLLFGATARDALLAAGESLFGRRVHFATLGPTSASPTDLLRLPACSSFAVSTVGDLVSESHRSENLSLLVFENLNLSQLDSTLVPLLRSYTAFHGELSTSRSPVKYTTPAGMWSSNILLGGILIDSPLALPMSREIWTCSTFIDASGKQRYSKGEAAKSRAPKSLFRLPYEGWVEWLGNIEHTGTSDTRVLATHVAREVECSSLFKRMLLCLAAAIDHTGSATSEPKRAGLLAEMTIIPYLLSRGFQLDTLLDAAPADVSPEDGFIDMLTKLFEKWGLDVR